MPFAGTEMLIRQASEQLDGRLCVAAQVRRLGRHRRVGGASAPDPITLLPPSHLANRHTFQIGTKIALFPPTRRSKICSYVLNTGLCKRNVPCLKIPAPCAAGESGLPLHSSISQFWRVLAQFSEPGTISFAQPCK